MGVTIAYTCVHIFFIITIIIQRVGPRILFKAPYCNVSILNILCLHLYTRKAVQLYKYWNIFHFGISAVKNEYSNNRSSTITRRYDDNNGNDDDMCAMSDDRRAENFLS